MQRWDCGVRYRNAGAVSRTAAHHDGQHAALMVGNICGIGPASMVATPDTDAGPQYAQQVFAFSTRFLATLAFVAAGLWVVLPVVTMATPAHAESVPCSCCDEQPAIGGGVACPGCQVGVPTGSVWPPSRLVVTAAWSVHVAPETTGVDPVPAEPPPR